MRLSAPLIALGLLAGLALPAARGNAADAPAPAQGIAALGEPKLPADFPYFPYVNPDAPKGGEITEYDLGSFDSFNQLILRGTAPASIGLIYDTLLRGSDDETAVGYGHVAQSIELAPDRLSVAFTLRPEARFQDGAPITAEDVVWTFNTILEKGRPQYKVAFAAVADAVAEGPRRVVFHFKSAENRKLPLEVGELPILPKHWWEGRDFSKPLTDIPLGSGPYKLDRVEMGRSLTFTRVKDYWAANLPTARGLNNYDTIHIDYYRDASVAMEAFKAGQIDIRAENIARNWATAYDFPAVQKGLVKKGEFANHQPTGMQGFFMNARRKIFADARVRQAIAWAFDFEWMNRNLFYNSYTRTLSYFSNSNLAATGLPSAAETALLEPFRKDIPSEVFTQEFKLPVTDGSGNNREELRHAFDLLRAAGWHVQDRKLVDASGTQFSFTILLDDPSYERVALPFVQTLQKLGMVVNVRTVDPSQYQHVTDDFDFDMTMATLPESDIPGIELVDYFSCDSAKAQGSDNLSGVCNPAVDALIKRVLAADSFDTLIPAARALDRVLLWNWYVVPNWHISTTRVAYWNRFGTPEKASRTGYDPASWWIDPALAAATDAARRQ